MSSASSNQSFVRDGAGYEELYPSGYKDPDELSERTPSATSPSSTNEDMELAEPEEGSDGGGKGIKSIVRADGLREFVMLPEWTVNNFRSTIKEVHFKQLEQFTKYPTTSLSVYPIRQKNAIMTEWTTYGCMNKHSRLALGSP